MGPGVTARYMSDDVRNKSTNETALMIAGGVMKSWMLTGMAGKDNKPAPLPISRQNSNAQMDIPSPSSSTPINTMTSPNASVTSTTNATFGESLDDQPRGRGRPRRRKSASGPDIMSGKKPKGFGTRAQDGGLTLPPSKIGRASCRERV